MSLIGMSKETYIEILDEVDDIYYLIALGGKLAHKPVVEKILAERHNLTGFEVKTFTELNVREIGFHFPESNHSPVWIADRPEPKLEDYPEVVELLKEK